jgi:hypothetical protein
VGLQRGWVSRIVKINVVLRKLKGGRGYYVMRCYEKLEPSDRGCST